MKQQNKKGNKKMETKKHKQPSIRQQKVAQLCREIKARQMGIKLIKQLPDDLVEKVTLFANKIDFDYLKHSDIMRVIKHIPGEWIKSPALDPTKIDYILDMVELDLQVRCWAGEPPPSCKIVEEEVIVPEQVIPARVEIRRKLVCNE